VFWIGLNPQPFTRVLHASVENLVKQVEPAAAAAGSPEAVPLVTSAAEIRNPKPEIRGKSE
jgi:hypothetical protein